MARALSIDTTALTIHGTTNNIAAPAVIEPTHSSGVSSRLPGQRKSASLGMAHHQAGVSSPLSATVQPVTATTNEAMPSGNVSRRYASARHECASLTIDQTRRIPEPGRRQVGGAAISRPNNAPCSRRCTCAPARANSSAPTRIGRPTNVMARPPASDKSVMSTVNHMMPSGMRMSA